MVLFQKYAVKHIPLKSVYIYQINCPLLWRTREMDFSNAPIAVADVDELSCTGESDHTELPPDGVLKRSLSDPFDISGGLQLEASLERLIWTFDENVSHVPLDSPNLNDKDGSRNHANNKVTLDAIKQV